MSSHCDMIIIFLCRKIKSSISCEIWWFTVTDYPSEPTFQFGCSDLDVFEVDEIQQGVRNAAYNAQNSIRHMR